MIRKYIYNWLTIIGILVFTSCNEEKMEYILSSEGSCEIEFEFDIRGQIPSRTLEGSKTYFTNGDVIHIIGHFTNGLGGNVDKYGCMRMENGKFKALPGSTLVWPDQATSGSFEAFYISGSSDLLDSDSQTYPISLSSVTIDSDPLIASTSENVAWGHAVSLEFTHALTYMQLVNLDPGIADSFRLYMQGLNNVFFLKRTGENLSLEFAQIPNQNTEEIYISRPVSNVNIDGEISSQVAFFLKPGDYSKFDLKTQNDELYLSFNNNITSNLIANVPYKIDIKKSQGIVITDQNDDNWFEDEDFWEVDVADFLYAIRYGEEYVNKHDQQILAQTQNGTKLLHNVDFKQFKDYGGLTFEPNIPAGITFDGANHYIQNVGYPIFRYNYGNIQNVGIKDIVAEVVSEEHNEDTENIRDNSRNGGLCCFNQSSGTIQNIRVENVSMTVKIDSSDSQESHNAGCIIGSNAGTLINLKIYGSYSITAVNKSEDVSASVYLGGIVGQNVGTISDVTELGEQGGLNNLNVINKCHGNTGTYYLGGAAGKNTKVVYQVILPNVNIDNTKSLGAISYVGGLVGYLDSDASSDVASLQSSTVSGDIYGGNCQKIGTTTEAASYTGGIAAGVYNVSVLDCRSVCNVRGYKSDSPSDVSFVTGGAFGRIFSSQQIIKNITVWGSVLEGSGNFLGNFAGAIPEGQTYDVDYKPFNMLIKEIVSKMVGDNI